MGPVLLAVGLGLAACGRSEQRASQHLTRAEALIATRDFQHALVELRLAQQLAPRDGSVQYLAARVAQRLGKISEAEADFTAAIAAAPRSLEPRLAYVQFLAAHHSVAVARAALEGYVRERPLDPRLLLERGALQQAQQDAAGALATYRQVSASGAQTEAAIALERVAALEMMQGSPADALSALDTALRQRPADEQALLLRAQIRLAQYDAAAARADLQILLRAHPRSARALQELARAQIADADRRGALQSLHAAHEAAPEDRDIALALARLSVQSGDPSEAARLAQALLERVPEDLAAHRLLVEAQLARPDLTAAKSAVQALEARAPARALGPYLEARLALVAHDDRAANAALERALMLEPRDVDALVAWVDLQARLRQPERAAVRLRALLRADPNDAFVHDLLGQLELARRDYAAAQGELGEAVRLAPRWAAAYCTLALAQSASGATQEALRTYERAVAAVGPDPSVLTDLAALDERLGRPEEAIRAYETLQAHSDRVMIARDLALLLVTYRKDRPSLDRARDLTARFASATDPALLDALGWVRYERGELDLALQSLSAAAERAPSAPQTQYHLAMVELTAGRAAQAEAHLEAAVAADTPFAGLQEARATLLRLRRAGGVSRGPG